MNDFIKRYGEWAMVAGAAEGIGAAFCEELARRAMNLVMVDVKNEEMEALAGRLEKSYGVRTSRIVQDLAGETAPGKCLEAMEGLDCRLLVYNAAYSRVKPFLSAAVEELDLYVSVNTRTPLHLAYLFARQLQSGGRTGGILLMSSLAGIWGTRLVAAYSGTKGFNLLLGEALFHEFKALGIDVCVCCAGATATPGYLETGPEKGIFGPSVMKPEQVAGIAISKMGRKNFIIPGWTNRFNYFILTRLFPRSFSVGMVNKVMASTYRNKPA